MNAVYGILRSTINYEVVDHSAAGERYSKFVIVENAVSIVYTISNDLIFLSFPDRFYAKNLLSKFWVHHFIFFCIVINENIPKCVFWEHRKIRIFQFCQVTEKESVLNKTLNFN